MKRFLPARLPRGLSAGPVTAKQSAAQVRPSAGRAANDLIVQRKVGVMQRSVLAIAVVLSLGVGVALAADRTDGSKPAPAAISSEVTHVPAKTLNRVGTGGVSGNNGSKLSAKPLNSHGKPEVLGFTLAWCPHCAASSWSLAIALSRFGTWRGLRVINAGTYYKRHGGKPGYPDAHGISFFRSTFKSRYLTFVDVIEQDVHGKNLEKPTKQEQAAFSFDHQGLPGVDIGGRYAYLASGYNPGLLGMKSWATIAGSLAHANGKLAQHIEGYANLLTAALCRVTSEKPHGVCSSTGVEETAKLLPGK
jgi:uncharacterized protein DUF929